MPDYSLLPPLWPDHVARLSAGDLSALVDMEPHRRRGWWYAHVFGGNIDDYTKVSQQLTQCNAAQPSPIVRYPHGIYGLQLWHTANLGQSTAAQLLLSTFFPQATGGWLTLALVAEFINAYCDLLFGDLCGVDGRINVVVNARSPLSSAAIIAQAIGVPIYTVILSHTGTPYRPQDDYAAPVRQLLTQSAGATRFQQRFPDVVQGECTADDAADFLAAYWDEYDELISLDLAAVLTTAEDYRTQAENRHAIVAVDDTHPFLQAPQLLSIITEKRPLPYADACEQLSLLSGWPIPDALLTADGAASLGRLDSLSTILQSLGDNH